MKFYWILHFFLFSAAQAFAQPAARLQVQGTIDQLGLTSDGRIQCVILKDHTLIRFHPGSLSDENALKKGDVISAVGTVVISWPNIVLNRVEITKSKQLVLNDSDTLPRSQKENSEISPATDLFPMSDSSQLAAVSAMASGKVDRLILTDGTTLQVPDGTFVSADGLMLGDSISTKGLGKKLGRGKFIDSMSILDAGGRQLIAVISLHGEQWAAKEGVIKQALPTPAGQVDGVLLKDLSVVKFTPASEEEISELEPGTRLMTAGRMFENQIRVDRVVLPEQKTVIDFSRAKNPPEQEAGVIAPSPITVTSKIEAIFHTGRGMVDAMVLADGTNVRIPSDVNSTLPWRIKVGDEVTVTGRGAKFPAGSTIEAQKVALAK